MVKRRSTIETWVSHVELAPNLDSLKQHYTLLSVLQLAMVSVNSSRNHELRCYYQSVGYPLTSLSMLDDRTGVQAICESAGKHTTTSGDLTGKRSCRRHSIWVKFIKKMGHMAKELHSSEANSCLLFDDAGSFTKSGLDSLSS